MILQNRIVCVVPFKMKKSSVIKTIFLSSAFVWILYIIPETLFESEIRTYNIPKTIPTKKKNPNLKLKMCFMIQIYNNYSGLSSFLTSSDFSVGYLTLLYPYAIRYGSLISNLISYLSSNLSIASMILSKFFLVFFSILKQTLSLKSMNHKTSIFCVPYCPLHFSVT